MKTSVVIMALWLTASLATGVDAGDIPPARAFHTVVNTQGQILIFGGKGATAPSAVSPRSKDATSVKAAPLFNDLWAYNQTGNTFVEMRPIDPPEPRQMHAAAAVGDKMYVFYGRDATGVRSDVVYYSASENKWVPAPMNGASKPEPRCNHTAVATDEGRILICGGSGETEELLGDLWEYDPVTGEWNQKASMPAGAAREGHSAVVSKGIMYVFGGCTGSSPVDDLRTYDVNGDSWQQPATTSGPEARHLHSAAVADDRMVVFGGIDAAGKELDDTWELDLNGTTWRKGLSLSQPLAASDATNFTTSDGMTAPGSKSKGNEKIFIFGGQSGWQPVDTVIIYSPGSPGTTSLTPIYPLLLDEAE